MEKSPNYPFLGLEKALGRAETIYKAAQSHAMPITVAAKGWGYSPNSSAVVRIVGTLKAYGLTDIQRDSAERKIKLTDQALRYFRDERAEVRQELLREFALRPKILLRLWKSSSWGSNPPSDEVARSHLKVDLGYNERAARSVLDIYKKNIAFAGLAEVGSVDEGGETACAPEEGDAPDAREQGSGAFRLAASASPAVSAVAGEAPSPGENMRRAVFPVGEGDVTLVFPDKMSRESFEDLRGYLDIFLKRQERAALASGGGGASAPAAADAADGGVEEGGVSGEGQGGEGLGDDVPF